MLGEHVVRTACADLITPTPGQLLWGMRNLAVAVTWPKQFLRLMTGYLVADYVRLLKSNASSPLRIARVGDTATAETLA